MLPFRHKTGAGAQQDGDPEAAAATAAAAAAAGDDGPLLLPAGFRFDADLRQPLGLTLGPGQTETAVTPSAPAPAPGKKRPASAADRPPPIVVKARSARGSCAGFNQSQPLTAPIIVAGTRLLQVARPGSRLPLWSTDPRARLEPVPVPPPAGNGADPPKPTSRAKAAGVAANHPPGSFAALLAVLRAHSACLSATTAAEAGEGTAEPAAGSKAEVPQDDRLRFTFELGAPQAVPRSPSVLGGLLALIESIGEQGSLLSREQADRLRDHLLAQAPTGSESALYLCAFLELLHDYAFGGRRWVQPRQPRLLSEELRQAAEEAGDVSPEELLRQRFPYLQRAQPEPSAGDPEGNSGPAAGLLEFSVTCSSPLGIQLTEDHRGFMISGFEAEGSLPAYNRAVIQGDAPGEPPHAMVCPGDYLLGASQLPEGQRVLGKFLKQLSLQALLKLGTSKGGSSAGGGGIGSGEGTPADQRPPVEGGAGESSRDPAAAPPADAILVSLGSDSDDSDEGEAGAYPESDGEGEDGGDPREQARIAAAVDALLQQGASAPGAEAEQPMDARAILREYRFELLPRGRPGEDSQGSPLPEDSAYGRAAAASFVSLSGRSYLGVRKLLAQLPPDQPFRLYLGRPVDRQPAADMLRQIRYRSGWAAGIVSDYASEQAVLRLTNDPEALEPKIFELAPFVSTLELLHAAPKPQASLLGDAADDLLDEIKDAAAADDSDGSDGHNDPDDLDAAAAAVRRPRAQPSGAASSARHQELFGDSDEEPEDPAGVPAEPPVASQPAAEAPLELQGKPPVETDPPLPEESQEQEEQEEELRRSLDLLASVVIKPEQLSMPQRKCILGLITCLLAGSPYSDKRDDVFFGGEAALPESGFQHYAAQVQAENQSHCGGSGLLTDWLLNPIGSLFGGSNHGGAPDVEVNPAEPASPSSAAAGDSGDAAGVDSLPTPEELWLREQEQLRIQEATRKAAGPAVHAAEMKLDKRWEEEFLRSLCDYLQVEPDQAVASVLPLLQGSMDPLDPAPFLQSLRWTESERHLTSLLTFLLHFCVGYDARLRLMLRRLCRYTRVPWGWFLEREREYARALRVTLEKQRLVEAQKRASGKGKLIRWAKIGTAVIVGATVTALTGGLAAPAIAGGLAVFGGGLGAFAATTAGTVLMTGVFGVVGGRSVGSRMHKRVKGLTQFEFVPVHASCSPSHSAEECCELSRKQLKRQKERAARKSKKVALAARRAKTSANKAQTQASGPAEEPMEEPAGEPAPPPKIPPKPSKEAPPEQERPKFGRGRLIKAWFGGGKKNSAPGSAAAIADPGCSGESPEEDAGEPEDFSPSAYPMDERLQEIARVRWSALADGRSCLDRWVPPVSKVAAPESSAAAADTAAQTAEAALPANPAMAVCVLVNGWLLDEADAISMWSFLPSVVAPGELVEWYSLAWEGEVLRNFGNAIKDWAKSSVGSAIVQRGIERTLLATLAAAITLPTMFLNLGAVIDNPWAMMTDRSEKSARLLADLLEERVCGGRPISLVGYSVGARVIFLALEILAQRHQARSQELARLRAAGKKPKKELLGFPDPRSYLQDVCLLGAPVPATTSRWAAVRGIVSGRLVNGFAEHDWLLGFLYRATALKVAVAGLGDVACAGVENRRLPLHIVGAHFQYQTKLPQILNYLRFF